MDKGVPGQQLLVSSVSVCIRETLEDSAPALHGMECDSGLVHREAQNVGVLVLKMEYSDPSGRLPTVEGTDKTSTWCLSNSIADEIMLGDVESKVEHLKGGRCRYIDWA